MILKINDNEVHLYGYIYHNDGVRFLESFSKIDGTYPEIEVFLHTFGGSVFDGNIIFNALITAKSTINTTIIGVGASMGAILSQAGKKRRQVNNGYMMIHAASGGTWGTAQDHINAANLLTEIEKNFSALLIKLTGKTANEVKKWLVGDNWFSASQAKKAGLIDEIVDPMALLDVEIEAPEKLGEQEIYNRFAAVLGIKDEVKPNSMSPTITAHTNELPQNTTVASEINQSNKKSNKMELELIQAFGLKTVTSESSKTAIITALKAQNTAEIEAVKKELETEKTAHNNLKEAVNAQKKSQITNMVKAAKDAGKIQASQIETYEKIGETTGVEALQTVLNGMNTRTPIVQAVLGTKGVVGITGQEGWNWDKYQKENPKALEAMRKDNKDAFNELFKAKFGTDYAE